MENPMRYRMMILLSAAIFAWVCLVALNAGLTVEKPVQKGLEIHEWGVFRVNDDREVANADMRAEWAALPKFVFGQTVGRSPPISRPPVARDDGNEIGPSAIGAVYPVEKPVVFVHSTKPLALEVRVDFPGGAPAVWWPRTVYPAKELDGSKGDGKRKEAFRYLEWHVPIKEPPKGQESHPQPFAVSKGHWIESLRAVKADDVFFTKPYDGESDRFVRDTKYERERFIYYDGLVPIGKRVAVKVDKDNVSVTSFVKHPVFDVTVIDRRTPDHTRVARLAKLEAGTKPTELDFAEVSSKEWPEAGLALLTKQLTDAGLFQDEAKSLADVWKKDFFQADGLTLFFRLPQEEYEKLLPMKLKPRPEKLVRVGLVLHPHCEPDLADRVAALARDLDDDDFDTRERAQKRLEDMGRAAFAHLRKLRAQAKSPEMQRRLDDLLDRYDAAGAIEP
jgi:hypothetical protein